MERRTTIVIADDHPVFRKGLVQILQSDRSLEIVAEAANGKEALAAIELHKPDIAVLDIDMPEMSGLETIKALNQRNLPTLVIFLTMFEEEKMFNKAIDLGARGYILKESAVNDILNSIRIVASGKHYISPSISNYLIRRGSKETQGTGVHGALASLTQSEKRILLLIAENKTSKEIAAELFISINTVENHRSNICRKLEITGNNALLRFALEHKSLL